MHTNRATFCRYPGSDGGRLDEAQGVRPRDQSDVRVRTRDPTPTGVGRGRGGCVHPSAAASRRPTGDESARRNTGGGGEALPP
eukprot:210825-Pyramimonas_sp.AAC.1